MRFIFFLTLIAVLFIPSSFASGPDEWYPFIIPEKLDPDSPANIGKLVLDAPAGKHGFVKVKDGHFYFEDGTRARFWGTNLCFSACFPAKEQAEMMADRLAFFGFNAVRLHHMDFFFAPNGIFQDINPGMRDPQMKTTGTLSPERLKRLDYLIYRLKERGIYVDMNLLVARRFTIADGVEEAGKMGIAAKPASIFDPKLIALQKQYAKDLLTHYNPYTKYRYCDDPVVALAEITNENSIFDYWKWNKLNGSFAGFKENPIPNHYVKMLDKKWNEWLKKKYGDDDRTKETRPIYKLGSLYNPDRIKDIEAFYTDVEKEYFDEMLSFLKKDVGLKAPVTGMGGYTCDSDAKAEENCDFIDQHAYWDHPSFPDAQWDHDNFRIHDKSMLRDKELGITSGFKKNPAHNKPRTMTEWNHCYPNEYSYESPVLMAKEAMRNDWDGLFQFAFKHMLTDPYKPDNVDSYFDIMANPQQLILMSVGGLLFMRADSPKDAIENGIYKLTSKIIVGSAGFIKNQELSFDDIMVTADLDGAVFLYSADGKSINQSDRLVLVALGGVKNTDSGWKNERFKWGRGPTLLKKISVELALRLDKKFKVYGLTAEGKRGKEVSTIFDGKIISFDTRDSDSPWFEITAEQAPLSSDSRKGI